MNEVLEISGKDTAIQMAIGNGYYSSSFRTPTYYSFPKQSAYVDSTFNINLLASNVVIIQLVIQYYPSSTEKHYSGLQWY